MEVSYFDKNCIPSTFQPLHFYYLIENPLINHAVLTIQKNWRGFHIRKSITSFVQKMKYRVHVIAEIVKTEETYLKDLSLLLINCYYPLKEQLAFQDKTLRPIVTHGELESLFINILSIYEFNSRLYSAFQKEFSARDPYAKFSQVLIRFATNFSIYYPYTAKCEAANRTLENLRRSNKRFRIFLSELEYTEKLKDMDLWSFLIKPVQRITKYPLLLAELLKHTPNSHPDYAGIEEALKIYKKINEENNLNIGRYENTMKLIELQELFSARLKLSIYHTDRTLILESCVASAQNTELKWRLIVLSDLVLIVSKDSDQKAQDRYIELSRNSIVKDLPDTKYFANLFSITGVNAGESFQAENKEAKMHIMSTLDHAIAMIGRKHVIEHLRVKSDVIDDKKVQAIMEENQNKKIEVHVVGTEQRIKDGQSRTYYVILISLGSERFHKCFKRHSEFRQLYKALLQTYPKKKLPSCEKKFKFLRTLCTKTVEIRKLVIENFLQLVLQDGELRTSQTIQDFIKFPLDFLIKDSAQASLERSKTSLNDDKKDVSSELPLEYVRTNSFNNIRSAKDALRRYSQMNMPIFKDENTFQIKSKSGFHAGKKPVLDDYSVFRNQNVNDLSVKNEELGAVNPEFEVYPTVSERQSNKTKPKTSRRRLPGRVYDLDHFKHNIAVLLLDGTSFEFRIDGSTRAKEICEKIATRLSLQKHDDFRIFVVEATDRERPLDRDECITEAMSLSEQKTAGVLAKVSRSVLHLFREHAHQKLIFKKYYYLPQNEECKLYQKDSARLDLLVSQALLGVKELCHDLDENKLLTVICLSTYNKYFDEIESQDMEGWFDSLDKKIFYEFVPESVLRLKSKEAWKIALHKCWETILSPGEFAVINDGLSHEMTDLRAIIKQRILNLIWSNSCFGMHFYKAKVYGPNEAASLRKWPTNRFLLGIKYGEIVAFSDTKAKFYLSHKLEDVISVKCYPVAIKLFFSDYEIRLDTKKSFEIQQLIETYKKLQEVLSQEEKE